jgi:menaquinone-9 beta-reductase
VATTYHGTYFPHRLFRPTVGRIFAVGDAAGQCLPLTAEGIRPALYFGVECGRIVQQIFDGRLGIAEGLDRYRSLVDRYRRAYRILRLAQWAAEHVPTYWFGAFTELAGRHPMLARWWPRYGWFGRFDPDPATAA